MSSVFELYDEEFQSLAKDISGKISEINTYENSQGDIETKRQNRRLAEGMIEQMQDLVKQMELEARAQESEGEKRELNNKIGIFRKTMNGIVADYKKIKEGQDRDTLLGDYGRGKGGDNGLDAQSSRIQNAQRVLQDTEDVAVEISAELGRNREKLEASRDRVREVGLLTTNARRILHSMSRRETQQRFLMYGVALILLIAIGILIYYLVKS